MKSEDTDVESYQQKSRQNRRSFRRNQSGQRRRRRSDRRVSEKQQNGDGESHDEDGGDKTDGEAGEGGKQGGGRPPRRNRYRRGPRRNTNKDESAAEKSEGEEKGGVDKDAGDGDGDGKKGGRDRRRRDRNSKNDRKGGRVERDLCIRVTNIARTMRIKELKQELRTRECNPIFITWNGYHGKCYLHFPKKPDQTDDDAGAELLKQLEDLTLTLSPREKEGGEPKQVTLKCEIMKRKEGGGGDAQSATNGTVLEGSRIETTDVTAV